MFMERALSRLRAAHGLAFAITVGRKPDLADLEAAGLGGVAVNLLDGRVECEERLGIETPAATGVTVAWNASPAGEAA